MNIGERMLLSKRQEKIIKSGIIPKFLLALFFGINPSEVRHPHPEDLVDIAKENGKTYLVRTSPPTTF